MVSTVRLPALIAAVIGVVAVTYAAAAFPQLMPSSGIECPGPSPVRSVSDVLLHAVCVVWLAIVYFVFVGHHWARRVLAASAIVIAVATALQYWDMWPHVVAWQRATLTSGMVIRVVPLLFLAALLCHPAVAATFGRRVERPSETI
jgi:hypothetical protein